MAFTEPWPAPMRLDLSSPLPEEGARVRLRVAFSAWPVLPFVLSSNSLNPLIRLYEDTIETRVIRKVRHRYTDIALADAYAPILSSTPSMLKVVWKGERLQLLAHPTRAENLPLILQFLADKGVPLGPVARTLLDAHGSAHETPAR